MHIETKMVLSNTAPVNATSYASAILNILDDSGEEKVRLANMQRAVLNILDDFAGEKSRLGDAQRAVLNILDDSTEEKERLGDTQRAVLNLLEDAESEKFQLEGTQKAILNILDDSDKEKVRLASTQRAIVNILDDFDLEKKKVEQVNMVLRNEIAERARAEEALRHANAAAGTANRELEAFSYSVAHDLRAPLRAIDGFSRLLLDDHGTEIGAKGRHLLEVVRKNTQQMGRLIDDLLAFSRLGRQSMKTERVRLANLVQTVLGELQRDQEGRKIKVSVGELGSVQADPAALKQVLANLLGNALKFTRGRDVATIEVGCTDEPEGVDGRVFYIKDNGAGFDMRYADKLFNVFQRLHRADEFEGTGVGLAIVQRVIHRHGGRVWADAKVDEGATFFFTLGGGTANDTAIN